MGCSGSKKDDEVDDPKDKVYQFQDLYYDEMGNLRHGRAHTKTKEAKEKELKDVLNIEEGEDLEAEDVLWYIMDAAWIADWFAYVHYESDTAPNPGPCLNERLLMPDYEAKKWVPRPRLIMASKKRSGDYRRVSRKTWQLYCTLYPGTCPVITARFKMDDNFRDSGLYDTSGWEVDPEFPLPKLRDHGAEPAAAPTETPNKRKESTEIVVSSTKDNSELMEDKALTKNLKAQMDFLGTRKIADDEEKKKKQKNKRRTSSKS